MILTKIVNHLLTIKTRLHPDLTTEEHEALTNAATILTALRQTLEEVQK